MVEEKKIDELIEAINNLAEKIDDIPSYLTADLIEVLRKTNEEISTLSSVLVNVAMAIGYLEKTDKED